MSLLVGAEANKECNRSSRRHNGEDLHKHLPRLFAGQRSSPNNSNDDDKEGGVRDDGADAEPSPGFLGRASSVTSFSGLDSYNRLMHAHTRNQLESPGMGTIPTYTKNMHAHTLHQLDELRRASRSEAGSPVGGRKAMLPAKVCGELGKLGFDDVVPTPPLNTPEYPVRKEPVIGLDFGKLRRRSLTTPYGARDLAAVEARVFATSTAR